MCDIPVQTPVRRFELDVPYWRPCYGQLCDVQKSDLEELSRASGLNDVYATEQEAMLARVRWAEVNNRFEDARYLIPIYQRLNREVPEGLRNRHIVRKASALIVSIDSSLTSDPAKVEILEKMIEGLWKLLEDYGDDNERPSTW